MLRRFTLLFSVVLLCCIPAVRGNSQRPAPASKKSPAGAIAPLPAEKKPLTGKQIFEKYRSMVFTVKTEHGLGTGFTLSVGDILTCFHVVRGATNITAERPQKTPYRVTHASAADEDLDFAILKFDPNPDDTKYVNLGFLSEVKVGDPIYVIGSPEGLEETLSEGIVSGKRQVGGYEQLQITAPISPGSSGSPVFDRFGDVVGMVVAYAKEGQQLNFAVSISSIIQRPWGVPVGQALAGQSEPKAKPHEVAAALVPVKDPISDAPDFRLTIDVSDALSGRVSKEDLKLWVGAELASRTGS